MQSLLITSFAYQSGNIAIRQHPNMLLHDSTRNNTFVFRRTKPFFYVFEVEAAVCSVLTHQ